MLAGQLASDCWVRNMDSDGEDMSWLTQEVSSLPACQDNYCRRPETVPMVRYVYDDDEYVEPNPNEVVICQRIPDNDPYVHRDIQRGLLDNFDTAHPPVVSLDSSVSQCFDDSCADNTPDHSQRFRAPVSGDELLNMQRKM